MARESRARFFLNTNKEIQMNASKTNELFIPFWDALDELDGKTVRIHYHRSDPKPEFGCQISVVGTLERQYHTSCQYAYRVLVNEGEADGGYSYFSVSDIGCLAVQPEGKTFKCGSVAAVYLGDTHPFSHEIDWEATTAVTLSSSEDGGLILVRQSGMPAE